MNDRADSPVLTQLLVRMADGDREAGDEFLPLVYDELRRLAHNLVQGEASRAAHATSLVHEAWLRIQKPDLGVDWEGRKHFFRLAARAMRRVLVDRARRRKASKRGGGQADQALDEQLAYWEERKVDTIAVHEALEKLEERDPRLVQIVELRFFGGLTIEETGVALDMTRRQVDHAWAFARGWLMRELKAEL